MADVVVPIAHDWKADQWDWPCQRKDGRVKIVNTDGQFEVALEVPFFTPKEIEVKVAKDQLVISCHHEPRTGDDYTIERQIHRAYKLPADVDPSTIKSNLNNVGLLVVTAAKKK